MNKHLIILMLGACLAVDSQAQSFGDFLKSTVSETARNIVSNTVSNGVNKVLTPNAGQASAPAADAGPAAALPPGCAHIKSRTQLNVGARPDTFEPAVLWPENAQCPVASFGDFEFKQAVAAKNAFREASAYPCNDCEGGRYFDAWGGRALIKSGDYSKEFPKLLLALEKGKSVGWKGTKYNVSITATGEQPIGDTPCKQFHYTLKQGAKTVSEYDGMFCKWQGAYSSEATWHETV